MALIGLDSVLIDANLNAAWNRVKENKGCAGVDKQSIEDFEHDLSHNLTRLQQEVRAGTYRPHPLLRSWMPKKDGGRRPLSIPAVRDRVLQTAVALIITPVFEAEFEDCSFAYRKGRSVDQAVRRVNQLRQQGFCWVVDCDIQAFFDEIDHNILIDEVEKLVPDPDILNLIKLWLDTEVVDGNDRIKIEKGVPQGSPISPLLSNLYLDHLDEALLDNNLRIVRFADDFLVLCKSRKRARDVLELTEEVLGELRLRINAEKTRIVDFNTGFRFLGVQFIRSLTFRPYNDDPDVLYAPDSQFSAQSPNAHVDVCANGALKPNGLGEMATSAVSDQEIKPMVSPASHLSEEDQPFSPPVTEEDIPSDSDPRLRTLYMMEHGTVLGKESERFVIRKKGEVVQEIPAIKVDQIMVFGNSQITTQTMHFCLMENIPIYLLSGKGRYYGVVDSYSTDPVLLHRDQFAKANDSSFCLEIARDIVRGKIENSRVLLMRTARRRSTTIMKKAANALKSVLGQLDSAETLEQIRGFEGFCARTYFAALSEILDHQWQFHGRVRQPPTDPVNSMLSYGYTLLFYNIYSFLRARGLNPHVGYLHPLRAGHPALASDLIEEFRAIVVDAVVFKLVLNEKVAPNDFAFSKTKDGPCYLNADARAVFIRSFESKLNAAVTHPVSGLKLDYRRCIEHQVQELAAVIRGRQTRYRPMVLR
jgi:CRISPR-associated protein Cas1